MRKSAQKSTAGCETRQDSYSPSVHDPRRGGVVPWRKSICTGKHEREQTASAAPRLVTHVAALLGGKAARDRQAESGAADIGSDARHAIERLEDPSPLALLDSRPAVSHLKMDMLTEPLNA